MLEFKGKTARLEAIYTAFAKEAAPWTEAAACRPGCADCCTNVGDVDLTTLEGMRILVHLQSLPANVQKAFEKALKQHRRAKENSKFARCAFLSAENRCSLYPLRPFSCRRLYSLKACGLTGPTVHRGLWTLGEATLGSIQTLDDTGYSGHIAHILELLRDPAFRKTYLSGGFEPEAIRPFALAHRLVINRTATR